MKEDVMRRGSNRIRASYDENVKQILANKEILAWILKECTEEFKQYSIKQIIGCIDKEPEIAKRDVFDSSQETTLRIDGIGHEDTSLHDQKVTFDIYFRTAIPGRKEKIRLIINIEAQNDYYPGYPLIKRGIYYGSRMISSQYGVIFENSHYEKIQKVYSIWICINPPQYREHTITKYHIQEECILGNAIEKETNYDLLSVIMVCLTKQPKEGERNLIHLLDCIFTRNLDQTEKRRILEETYGIESKTLLGKQVNDMCNASEGIYQEGIKEGIELNQKRQFQKMVAMGLEKENIMQILDLSDEKYAEMLKEYEENSKI